MLTLRRISYYGFLALLIYMPFHIFLSQSLSLATGGLEVWKAAKDVVLFGLTLFTICLVLVNRVAGKLFYWLLGLSVTYGLLHLGLWAVNPDTFSESAVLGIVHNNRLPFFLLLGYGAHTLNRDKFVFSSIITIVLGVSTVVALLAIVQYMLPKDVLTHLGYSLERGARPAFFVDDNPALPRVMSTLREPNALGAYLVLPISLLVALFGKLRGRARTVLLAGVLALHLAALLLTSSRSAWLATMLAVVLVVWWRYSKQVHAFIKRFWPLVVVVVLCIAIGAVSVRNSAFVRDHITHAPVDGLDDLSSNDYHALLTRAGVEAVASQPFGYGPGTAGLASIQNPGGGQLTENYFLQIAYEVGLIGLLVLLAIMVVVYRGLLARRDWIGAALLASFWGYVVTNMLLHTWSNEAVAAQWWLLAGAAIPFASYPRKKEKAG